MAVSVPMRAHADVAHGAVATEAAHDARALGDRPLGLPGAGVRDGRLVEEGLAPAVRRGTSTVIRSRIVGRSANFVGLITTAARLRGLALAGAELVARRGAAAPEASPSTSGPDARQDDPRGAAPAATRPAMIHGR